MTNACEWFRQFARHSPDILWLMNSDLELLYVSEAVYHLTGFTSTEALTTPHNLRYSSATIQRFSELKQAVADSPNTTNHLIIDVELLTKDNGPSIVCEARMIIIRDGNGDIQGIAGITQDIRVRKKSEIDLARLISLDSLTGVYNRHFFLTQLHNEIERARRYSRPLTAAMFDLDHFKNVNDTYGHAIGDIVLSTFAHACTAYLRKYTVFGRLGGEEFGLCLQEANIEQALIVAERIKDLVEHLDFHVDNPIKLTVSIGLAAYKEGDDEHKLMERADKALYESKNTGRNRISIAKNY